MEYHPLTIPEPDWKHLRDLKNTALERFCRQALQEVERVTADSSRSYHQRYQAVFRLLNERDRELASAFNDLRRSQAFWQLAAMWRLGVVTDEELSTFSQKTQEAVHVIAGKD